MQPLKSVSTCVIFFLMMMLAPVFSDGDSSKTISGKIHYSRPTLKARVGLDFSILDTLPVRRVLVKALREGIEIARCFTGDDGSYVLHILDGQPVEVKVFAQIGSLVEANVNLGVEDLLNGALLDISVVDNDGIKDETSGSQKDVYSIALNGGLLVTVPSVNVDLMIGVNFNGVDFIDRSSAPFAILDVALSVMLKITPFKVGLNIPKLYINWSPRNSPITIGTSLYVKVGWESHIFLLGAEDVDTDEYDVAVIAKLVVKFCLDSLFRDDSIGGLHAIGDILDTATAFTEGLSTALASLITKERAYWDCFGKNQAGGLIRLDLLSLPALSQRGPFNEIVVADAILKLVLSNNGEWIKVLATLEVLKLKASILVNLPSFLNIYRQLFQEDQLLQILCDNALISNALSDVFDLLNVDGLKLSLNVLYPPGNLLGLQAAAFWRQYRLLSVGVNILDNIVPYSNLPGNKFGVVKVLRLIGTGNLIKITLNADTVKPVDWIIDVLQEGGTWKTFTGSNLLSIQTQIGKDYLIRVRVNVLSGVSVLKVTVDDGQVSVVPGLISVGRLLKIDIPLLTEDLVASILALVNNIVAFVIEVVDGLLSGLSLQQIKNIPSWVLCK